MHGRALHAVPKPPYSLLLRVFVPEPCTQLDGEAEQVLPAKDPRTSAPGTKARRVQAGK